MSNLDSLAIHLIREGHWSEAVRLYRDELGVSLMQAEAKVAYYDHYADFAILKINPQELPEQVEKIEFSNKEPSLGDEVFIVGNTEDQGFSFHSGYLSDLFDINGQMPQGSYVINMNTTGGASGSPVINSESKAIGI